MNLWATIREETSPTHTFIQSSLCPSFRFNNMIFFLPFIGLAAALTVPHSAIQKRAVYSGTPFGFASKATGGGNAATVTPITTAQLISYLTDSSPRNIVISGEFKFAGTEGTATYDACDAYSCTPSNGGQALLNTLNGCSKPTYKVTIDKAAYQGISVKSNKSLIGKNGATLNGKGLRLVGVSNIIIQNIKARALSRTQYVIGANLPQDHESEPEIRLGR